MFEKRTDLAVEAKELWLEHAENTTKLPGVVAETRHSEGYPLTTVKILDRRGEAALGKPAGTYLTVDLTSFWQRTPDFFGRAVRAVGKELQSLLPGEGSALIVALGNPAMTADAIGPQTADNILVTRHLLSADPNRFVRFRSAAVQRTGVLGTTGVESAEAVLGLVGQVKPAVVIAVDALASRRCERVCTTVQISDTGICPGSGVGNHRAALTRETLGVPVIALGIPTVVDTVTLVMDLIAEIGGTAEESRLRAKHQSLLVTPRDIDAQVRDLGKVLGYSINWALQGLEIEEISALLS